MYKNVADQVVRVQLINKSDGSNITSGTVTVEYLGDNGDMGGSSTSVVHEGSGLWSYLPSQAQTNFDCITFTFSHANAITTTVLVYTTSLDTIADAILLRDWTAITEGTPTRNALNALRFLRNKWEIVGSPPYLYVKKEDDSTDAWDSALTTSASTDVVTSSDPS